MTSLSDSNHSLSISTAESFDQGDTLNVMFAVLVMVVFLVFLGMVAIIYLFYQWLNKFKTSSRIKSKQLNSAELEKVHSLISKL